MSYLNIAEISKTFGSKGNAVKALDKVSASVQKGEICGLLGNNGAGKTTLIKCISGLLIPENGGIFLDDINLLKNKTERSKRISVLLDGGRSLFLNLSVGENIKYFSLIKGSPIKLNSPIAQEVVELLQIEPLMKKVVAGLSYGMRQRVAIAVALICSSEIIILDEPTKGLDVRFQEDLSDLLLTLKREFKNTIIVSSHDMNFIRNVCDNCILLDKGNIVKQGSIAEFNNPFSKHKYTVRFSQELSDEVLAKLRESVDISETSETRISVDLLWDCRMDLCELFNIISNAGASVTEISGHDNLNSSILSIARGSH